MRRDKREFKVFLQGTILLLILLYGHSAGAYCFDEAGKIFGISPQLLRAVASVESSFAPWAINYGNKNGSYDVCMMQINSSWHDVIGKELWNALSDPCTCVKVGAWILGGNMAKHGYNWKAVGYYNATSKEKRKEYIRKVKTALKTLGSLTPGGKNVALH